MSGRGAALSWMLCLVLPLVVVSPGMAQERLLVWQETLKGEGDDALRWPVSVAAASTNEIVVADAHRSRLLVFHRKDATWIVADTVALDSAPRAIAHDGSRYAVSLRKLGGLVAVEGQRHQLRPIGLPSGSVPGALAGLTGGGFLIHDLAGERVLQIDGSGSLVNKTAVPGQIAALAAAPSGGFYAAFPDEGLVRLIGANGEELESFPVPSRRPVPAWPTGVVVEPDGDLILADRHGNRLVVLDSAGRFEGVGSRAGWEPGLLRFPAGLSQLPDGRIAVVDQMNGRVQLFARVDGAGGS